MKRTLTIEKGSTLFLRLAVSVIGLGVLALCVSLLPLMWTHAYNEYPDDGYAVRVVVAAMYASTIPFYIGIYKGWRILDSIDKNKAFSVRSVRSLGGIALCAAIISLFYAISLPFFYIWAQHVDAPGLMVIGLFLTGMPLIISVAIELLRRLLIEAINVKSENDLTV